MIHEFIDNLRIFNFINTNEFKYLRSIFKFQNIQSWSNPNGKITKMCSSR